MHWIIFVYEGKLLKVYAALVGGPSTAAPGFAVQHADGICVACGDETSLLLTEVQLEGGKRMGAAQFLAGHPMKEPVLLGGTLYDSNGFPYVCVDEYMKRRLEIKLIHSIVVALE